LPLRLPNLDDLKWKDLVADGRSLIPSSAEEWTNHNASDPGMTLLELFAYVSGTLMYQLNRVTDSDTAAFLTLINGSEWKHEKQLEDRESLSSAEYRHLLRNAVSDREKRHSLRKLFAPARAVTAEDFACLAGSVAGAERVTSIPRVNLEKIDSASRWQDCPGHISVVVLSSTGAAQDVLANVRLALEPARLLTTRVHVVPPHVVPVGVRLTVVPHANVYNHEALRQKVAETLTRFLDPRVGWFHGAGWPFGRSLYISELYQVVGEIAGVKGVTATLDRQGALQDEVVVDASFADRVTRRELGAMEEVRLLPDELFDSKLEAQQITVARNV
jgi:hypothetical protein